MRDRRASVEATQAYDRMNEMVADDHGPARITFGAGAILRFPGKVVQPTNRPVTINDVATVTGRLYYLAEDKKDRINARIRPSEGSQHVACTADANLSHDLRRYFLDDVRVHGQGNWSRSETGVWTCVSLHIQQVAPVSNVSLRHAIYDLRSITPRWPDVPVTDHALLQEDEGQA